MKEIYGYLIKENLGDNKLLVSKNSSDFFAYILEKNENNPHIGSLAYELCNIECDGLIKCEFYEDKNNYYFITDLYETINNTFLEDYAIRNYVLTRQNLIKFLNVFIKLESLGLDYFMSNKIYIK
ncbi:hypothetical protein, partial [Campylobacter sp. 2018MI13]|uniref:hypothetical protein n=1 Tax=Campylobacter sp. 2018MI13 TaxID=2836737 RepID=UPI001BDAEE49